MAVHEEVIPEKKKGSNMYLLKMPSNTFWAKHTNSPEG